MMGMIEVTIEVDRRGQTAFVNPEHIVAVIPTTYDMRPRTRLLLTGENAVGSARAGREVMVTESADEIAQRIRAVYATTGG